MRISIALFALLACCFNVTAAVPNKINYQGYLTNASSVPVDATVSMSFSIYDVSSGGSALYTETQSVTVSNGAFNVLIGSVTPLALPFDVPYFLGVKVGADAEMTPRSPIGASAYGIRAATADALAPAATVAGSQIAGPISGNQLASSLTLSGTTTGTFSGPLTGNVTGNVAGNASTATTLATPRTINGVAFDGSSNIVVPPASLLTGCPGPRIGGVCLLAYSNAQATNFQAAAQICANQGGDLCTDSQSWPLSVGSWQNIYLSTSVLNGPHWTASFADNDQGFWNGANGGTGDNNSPNSSYGYACCGGYTPPNPNVPVLTLANVKVTAIHNAADTYFSGAVAYCSALNSDICSDSQTIVLRDAGYLTVATWTNSHADNDGALYSAINGGTADDTQPSHQYGFACCASLRPADLSCPVLRTQGVCATAIHNVADTNFLNASKACAAVGADLCSIAQSSVLRTALALSVPVWTNSHSDNDASNATVAVGAMPDNPALSMNAGYACCLN